MKQHVENESVVDDYVHALMTENSTLIAQDAARVCAKSTLTET